MKTPLDNILKKFYSEERERVTMLSTLMQCDEEKAARLLAGGARLKEEGQVAVAFDIPPALAKQLLKKPFINRGYYRSIVEKEGL